MYTYFVILRNKRTSAACRALASVDDLFRYSSLDWVTCVPNLQKDGENITDGQALKHAKLSHKLCQQKQN